MNLQWNNFAQFIVITRSIGSEAQQTFLQFQQDEISLEDVLGIFRTKMTEAQSQIFALKTELDASRKCVLGGTRPDKVDILKSTDFLINKASDLSAAVEAFSSLCDWFDRARSMIDYNYRHVVVTELQLCVTKLRSECECISKMLSSHVGSLNSGHL
ncbi:hypothetical protein niasHT_001899 [Heterodera trifolii]|uniref:Uncharacterized protein n=1 Tax=Heterodera trifolii TaxID=157864 RepID=A0ABD2LSA2_9BILA